jgi:two-component system heavy metal sensor histidine kinase CusS
MFSNRIEPRSISSQLVLLFTLASLLLLSCGLGVFYWLVVRHAFEEDNAVLADKAFALKADLRNADGAKLLDAEINARRAGEHGTYWIRLLDQHGQTVVETSGMSDLLAASVFPTAAKSTSLTPTNYRSGSKLFSLVALTEESSGQLYTIQIAQDRSADEQFMKKFGALLGLVLACSIVASVLIAVSVARRGLRPLTQMTAALERITPTHLNERIQPSRWPRELQPLASAFDEMLDRLEDSFTRLSQFSGDLAHELRTPIANISGAAQVALTRDRTSAEYREVLETTAAECERLSATVDNLLFLARADAAREQIERTSFNARAAAEKIVTFYRTIGEDRHIAIECSGDGKVYGDPVLFSRAISNLMENALRFTPDGGSIDITISTDRDWTEISVKDIGCGIEPEHLPRVFDRFYRADGSRSSHGTGLGLALVKSIVDLHGGLAKIDSQPGRGTSVVITFPTHA